MPNVRRSHRWVALLLLVLWMPAVTHCDLEHLDLSDFLTCCQHSHAAPHQDNDCDTDACADVESGFYKIEDQPPLVSVPVATPVWMRPFTWEPPPTDQALCSEEVLAPPEIPRLWQFTLRAALLPRAPSPGLQGEARTVPA